MKILLLIIVFNNPFVIIHTDPAISFIVESPNDAAIKYYQYQQHAEWGDSYTGKLLEIDVESQEVKEIDIPELYFKSTDEDSELQADETFPDSGVTAMPLPYINKPIDIDPFSHTQEDEPGHYNSK